MCTPRWPTPTADTGVPHFDNKFRVEQVVRELGFPSFTIVRPVFFMENFLQGDGRQAIEGGTLALGIKPDTALQMIASRDIGEYTLRAFEDHEQLDGVAFDIAGDELTMPEAGQGLRRRRWGARSRSSRSRSSRCAASARTSR